MKAAKQEFTSFSSDPENIAFMAGLAYWNRIYMPPFSKKAIIFDRNFKDRGSTGWTSRLFYVHRKG